MSRAGDPADDPGGVPPSIAAIMAAIRAEVAAPPVPAAVEADVAEADVAEPDHAPAGDHLPAVEPATDKGASPAPPLLLLDEAAPAVAPDAPPATDAFAPAAADVRAALAPLLKDWLDAHLPEIVETAVHAEIRRLTGQI